MGTAGQLNSSIVPDKTRCLVNTWAEIESVSISTSHEIAVMVCKRGAVKMNLPVSEDLTSRDDDSPPTVLCYICYASCPTHSAPTKVRNDGDQIHHCRRGEGPHDYSDDVKSSAQRVVDNRRYSPPGHKMRHAGQQVNELQEQGGSLMAQA